MLIEHPMTPAEDAATAAWDTYAEAAQTAHAAWDRPSVSMAERRANHERLIDAHRTFESAYRAITEPTPPSMEHERNQLACEGALLLAALAGFVGLFLPDLEASFWPLAITFVAAGLLGAWVHRFAGRLGSHLGRRL